MVFTKAGKLKALLKSPYYRKKLFFQYVAAGVEHEEILLGLDCQTVIDIGAGSGQFALAARNCLPAARIISFEPLPGSAAKFRKVFEGDEKVVLHEAAIGPVSGAALMHVSKREDSSSLLPITSAQVSVFPGTEEATTLNVRVNRLAEFVSPEDICPNALLKLDVQGYELEALRGCEELLARFCHVYVECSYVELYAGQALAEEVIEWLRGRGFLFLAKYNTVFGHDGKPIQADLLFRRQESACAS